MHHLVSCLSSCFEGGVAIVNVSQTVSLDRFANLRSVGLVSADDLPQGYSVVLKGLSVISIYLDSSLDVPDLMWIDSLLVVFRTPGHESRELFIENAPMICLDLETWWATKLQSVVTYTVHPQVCDSLLDHLTPAVFSPLQAFLEQ